MTPIAPTHEWEELVSAAVARAVEPVDLVDGGERDRSGLTGFLPVVEPFARVAGDQLEAAVDDLRSGLDLASVRSGFERWLAHRLVRLAARTLVLELNVARVTNALPGESPTARFDSFVVRTASRRGLTQLLADYPVLARLLGQACGYGIEAWAELCTRLHQDRADIVAQLLGGEDPGVAQTVEFGLGDGHQHGRAVAVVCFASGARVVYKPRPVAVHKHFNEMVAWFNGVVRGPDLRTVALLDRQGYGWAEFIPYGQCTSEGEVRRFYRRHGRLLALLRVLAGTDFHAENLIAHGEHPVLVDLETLFHPDLDGGAADLDPAQRAWESSVHRVGLLPVRLLGDEAVLDFSGLGGDAGVPSPLTAVDWERAGTDEMRLVRRPTASRGASNRPVLAGVVVEPSAYGDALMAGFRDGYRAIAAARTDLLGRAGMLVRFADDEVRVVVRPTQLYMTMLGESTHPDVLRDSRRRDALLAELGSNPAGDPYRARLIDDEIADLWAGDVPYFWSRPSSVDLWSSAGRRIDGVLGEPMLGRVCAAIDGMGETDFQAQEWVIRAALASRAIGDVHAVEDRGAGRRVATSSSPRSVRDHLLVTAREIADLLASTACRAEGRTNWLGLELAGDRFWHLAPLGAALGNGYCGPALFLAQLGRVTGETRYAEEARRVVAGIPTLLEQLAEHPDLGAVGSGGFAGLGGIAYALAHLSRWLDDSAIAGWVAPAVDLAVAAAVDDVEIGVVGGTAGGLATLVAVHQDTGLASAWAGAQQCADRLLAQPTPAEPGPAAGAAGAGWALLRFATAGGGAGYEQAGLAALRTAWAAVPHGRAWCRGLTGLALATVDSRAGDRDSELADRVASAVRLVDQSGALPNHSLCHGELGRLALLQAAGDEAQPVAELAQTLAQAGPRCGTPNHVPSPGLLTGLAGIGHGALRLAFPNDVPSLLMLHPSGRAA
ncbi:MAG: type 2 lanthipeptide synthetase LanM family protein [Micromonosporaceae bacterium]